MNKDKLKFEEYATVVASKLNIESAEKLETIYGDLIRDCYDMGDTVDQCAGYCDCNDEVDSDDEDEDDLYN